MLEVGFVVVVLFVLFYVISMVLYFYIFFYVRKVGMSVGVKWKVILVKNILIMVFINFIFFILLMVCILLFVYRFE